jgi:hypothetical protein
LGPRHATRLRYGPATLIREVVAIASGWQGLATTAAAHQLWMHHLLLLMPHCRCVLIRHWRP